MDICPRRLECERGVFTRYWLALVGEWPWEKTPNLPPEIIFFPTWFLFSIYNFSSWTRGNNDSPSRSCLPGASSAPCPRPVRLDELFPAGRERMNYDLPIRPGFLANLLFLRPTNACTPIRSSGVSARSGGRRFGRGVEWIIRHQDADGAWGGDSTAVDL